MFEKKFLEEQIALYQEQLGNVAKVGLNVFDFDMDCSLLSYQKHREHDIRDSAEYKSMFEKLANYEDNPCVYWFDSDDEINGCEIFHQIDSVQKKGVIVPAHGRSPHNGYCLYVGKATRNIHGRLMMHLGVHKNSRSHGLNILYWDESFRKNFKLKFHFIPFPKNEEWRNLISLMEFLLSVKNNPIIGKHTR